MPRNDPSADPRRWAMFSVLLVGAFLPPLDFFIVNVALPSIREDFGATSSAEQAVISAYAGFYAVTLITGGRLGDLFGRGRAFFLGLLGFAAASTLCGFASSPWTLVAGRALQGLTAAVMAPQALASIQAIFPESEKSLALSLYGAVFGLAAVAGQALGGVLISLNLLNLGWRAIFLINLPVAILVVMFGIPLIKETRAQEARKLDLVGTALSVITLAALIVPLIEGRDAGWPWWSWLSLLAAPALAWFFLRYESRLAIRGGAPLLDPAVLRAPGLGRALLIALLLYSIGTFFLLFSIYLQSALHVDPLSAGLVFLPFGVGFLLGPLSTPFFSRILGSYANPFGMGLEIVGIVSLAGLVAVTPVGTPLAFVPLAIALFIIGFGQGVALPTLMRMVTGRVAPVVSGMIAGIASSTLQISTSLSVAIIGGIFYSVLGQRHDPTAIAHAFVVAMYCIVLCLAIGAGLGVSLALSSRRETSTGPTRSRLVRERS
ncbi:MFS transporter [Caballeronia sp. AZ10_KS36]|uniref:MFS transporter n=1 Tax=Caballeronia sp. AZ10_KS36 TaxID=2921757 RepID=UPI0032F01EB3